MEGVNDKFHFDDDRAVDDFNDSCFGARDKFKRGDGSNISVTVMKELDPVMVSEQIGSFVGDKRWA